MKQTAVWVAFGYLTIIAMIVTGVILLVIGATLAIKADSHFDRTLALGLALAGFLAAAFIFTCLWIRFNPPTGIILTESEFPDLHSLIRKIADHAGGVRFDQVLLDPEMNASAVQNPRLGIFGWYRTYLVIGLPLMETLSVDEFKAVIAHEIAHLSQADGKVGAWLHRTRLTWERIMSRSAKLSFCPMSHFFFRWFWPQFNSRSFVLLRHNELDADRRAAEWISPTSLSSGLKRLAIQGERVEREFWDPLEKEIYTPNALPADVMEQLSAFLRAPTQAEQDSVALSKTLRKTTNLTDSHPSLASRLSELGPSQHAHSELPEEIEASDRAAARLLSEEVIKLAHETFSQGWLAEANDIRSTITLKPVSPKPIGVKKAWDRIAALARLDGLEKIQPELLELLEKKPNHSGAVYLRGCYLAQKDDPESIQFLERSANDPTLAGRAYETLADVYTRSGQLDLALALQKRIGEHEQELRSALVERGRVSAKDTYLPHDLTDQESEELHDILDVEPLVQRAWLAAKHVQHFPHWRHLILILELRDVPYPATSEADRKRIETQILDRWDRENYTTVLIKSADNLTITQAVRRCIVDCEVFRRR